MEPVVSVVVPNFNRGSLMGETLDSLINQEFSLWEAIVVDDGSTDNSLQVAAEYAARDARIRWMKRDRQPGGAPTCRNIGIENARGKYLVFLDSDDLLAPHCLRQRVEFMDQHPGLAFAVFPMWTFTTDPQKATHIWNKPSEEPDMERFLRLDAVWQTTGPIWRREAVQKIGGFTEGLACWQDVDFHLKALVAGLPYTHADAVPDSYYRRHEQGSVSQAEISTPPKLRSRLQIFKTFSGALAGRAQNDDSLKEKLQLLGSNVVFGALRVHQWRIAANALNHGRRLKVFSMRYLAVAMLVAAALFLRLSKLAPVQGWIQRTINRWRRPSTIGTFTYNQTS